MIFVVNTNASWDKFPFRQGITGKKWRAPLGRVVKNRPSVREPRPLSRICQSMLGSTRSGGRCPSANVRMLMMTFSPMSARPSWVAEPI